MSGSNGHDVSEARAIHRATMEAVRDIEVAMNKRDVRVVATAAVLVACRCVMQLQGTRDEFVTSVTNIWDEMVKAARSLEAQASPSPPAEPLIKLS